MVRHHAEIDTVLTGDELETQELVAYLDNELEPEHRQRVEERLARDDAYRRRLHELEQAWEMLDWLPRGQASPEFVHTTVEMVALRTEEDLGQVERREQWVQRLRTVVVAVTLLAAIWAGFAVMQWRQTRREREFLADMPLVQDLELYRVADSVTFVRDLHRNGFFADAEASDNAQPDTPASSQEGK